MAFTTKSYRILSAEFAVAPDASPADEVDEANGTSHRPEAGPPVGPASAAQARGGVAEQE
ncbi:hypothetical protein [Microbacterium sp. bgisy203]|uniref:hypothetical protein n=1 Tax=Microbacterium sp. bgisy203 TaxID=3413799 RepID=UPI003D743854